VLTWLIGLVVIVGLAALAWGWFEAGWLRRRVLDVELAGLPRELDGIRVAHVSDLHLGTVSRGERAAADAFAWIEERRPDLVLLTGDLVSRRSGIPRLRRLLERLADSGSSSVAVLGNHDLADSRDPFSESIDGGELQTMRGLTLLADEAVEVDVRGKRVEIVGVDPRTYARKDANPGALASPAADLRILLCHFPGIARRIEPGSFDLVLAGHFHAGQIVVPVPRRPLRLAHLSARDVEGIYRYGDTVLHVSPGIGTTFVPFRFFARPEATELNLRSAR
jgi:predicted MPP superfamily phosphohydrolase